MENYDNKIKFNNNFNHNRKEMQSYKSEGTG